MCQAGRADSGSQEELCRAGARLTAWGGWKLQGVREFEKGLCGVRNWTLAHEGSEESFLLLLSCLAAHSLD